MNYQLFQKCSMNPDSPKVQWLEPLYLLLLWYLRLLEFKLDWLNPCQKFWHLWLQEWKHECCLDCCQKWMQHSAILDFDWSYLLKVLMMVPCLKIHLFFFWINIAICIVRLYCISLEQFGVVLWVARRHILQDRKNLFFIFFVCYTNKSKSDKTCAHDTINQQIKKLKIYV